MSTCRMDERTAAPSLPKSSAKMAKGSDDGSAIVAPASAVMAVLNGAEISRIGTAPFNAADAGTARGLSSSRAAHALARTSARGPALCTTAFIHAGAGASGSASASASQQHVLMRSRPTTRKARSSCVARSIRPQKTA